MTDAPYPDLDPELHDVVRALAADFSTPPELLPAPEFRALLDRIGRRAAFAKPPGLEIADWRLVAPRPVRLRLYRPALWSGEALILYMHGGGWTVGSLDGHDQICADLAAEAGMAVASVDYALSPENRYPVALEECLAAFAAIEAGEAPLAARPARIYAGGDSCGANLALALALRRRDEGLSAPAGLVLVYPCTEPDFGRDSYRRHADAPFLTTSLMIRFWKNYLGEEMAGDAYAWPSRAPLSGLPRSVVLTAALDPLVDEGDALAAALAAAGVPTAHLRAERLIHGFLRFRGRSALAREAFGWLAGEIRGMEPPR